MINWILGLLLAGIVLSAIWYIVKQKKQGAKCIGCPHSITCANRGKCKGAQPGTCGSECHCAGHAETADS